VFVGYDNTASICYDTVVANCVFKNTLGDGVHVMNAANTVIVGNVFDGTGDDCIGIIADVTATPPSRVLVYANQIYNAGGGTAAVSGTGIRVEEATDVQIVGNSIYTTYEGGIFVSRASSTTVYNTRLLISGNKLYNTTQHAGMRGSITLQFCSQASVKGNQVIDPAYGEGIDFLDCDDLDITDNTVRGSPSRGIASDDTTTTNVAATWDRINICRNVIEYAVANGGIYVMPASGKTVTNLMVNGNDVSLLGDAGAAVYWNRVTGGRVCNNTNPHSYAYTAGGTVSSVTAANNN
jgi:hypothetical protein